MERSKSTASEEKSGTGKVTPPDAVEDALEILGDAGWSKPTRGRATESDETEREDDARGGDPIRIYLREMGAVSLLDREGEQRLARGIEEAQHRLLAEALATPIVLRYLLTLPQRLEDGELRVSDVVRDFEEPDSDDEEVAAQESNKVLEEFLEGVPKLKKAVRDIEKAEAGVEEAKTDAVRKRRGATLDKKRASLLEVVQSLSLNPKQIDSAVEEMRRLNTELRHLSEPLDTYEKRFGKPAAEIEKLCREAKRGVAAAQKALKVDGEEAGNIAKQIATVRKRVREAEAVHAIGAEELAVKLREIGSAESQVRDRQEGADRGQPASGGQHRQEAHQPRFAAARPGAGGQHRPDARGRQVRVPARVQVLDLRDLVDSPGDDASDRRSGADHPHPRAHGGDDQQAGAHFARAGAGDRPRADGRGAGGQASTCRSTRCARSSRWSSSRCRWRRRSAKRRTRRWATSSRTRTSSSRRRR